MQDTATTVLKAKCRVFAYGVVRVWSNIDRARGRTPVFPHARIYRREHQSKMDAYSDVSVVYYHSGWACRWYDSRRDISTGLH